jgi:hypothetical protein
MLSKTKQRKLEKARKKLSFTAFLIKRAYREHNMYCRDFETLFNLIKKYEAEDNNKVQK